MNCLWKGFYSLFPLKWWLSCGPVSFGCDFILPLKYLLCITAAVRPLSYSTWLLSVLPVDTSSQSTNPSERLLKASAQTNTSPLLRLSLSPLQSNANRHEEEHIRTNSLSHTHTNPSQDHLANSVVSLRMSRLFGIWIFDTAAALDDWGVNVSKPFPINYRLCLMSEVF